MHTRRPKITLLVLPLADIFLLAGGIIDRAHVSPAPADESAASRAVMDWAR
jgi:hypothetical protein